MRLARPTLLTLATLPLIGCWSWNASLDSSLRPPDRPRNVDEVDGKMPDWMRNPPITENELFVTRDAHRTKAVNSFTLNIRLGAPRHRLLTNRCAIRIDIPIGYSEQPIGLPELTALAIGDTPAIADGRPSLRTWINRRGGDLLIDVGATHTRFTIHVPTAQWEAALNEIAIRLNSTSITKLQFGTLQDRLIQSLLDRWSSEPAVSYASQWNRYGDLDRTSIIGSIQDRYLAQLKLFQRRYYQPNGAVVGVWVPEMTERDSIVASTRFALAAWQTVSTPAEVVAAPEVLPIPTGVRWIENEGRSRIAILIPNSAITLEQRVILECLTMGGIGGRLGEFIENKLDRELVFQVREIGIHDRRFLVLQPTVDPESVTRVWSATNEAWNSLGTAPPFGKELAEAKARVQFRLARRQDQSDEWLDAANAVAIDEENPPGPIRDLHSLAKLDHLRALARTWSETKLAMVVAGGTVPEGAPTTFTEVVVTAPVYRRSTGDAETWAVETNQLLDHAVKTVAGKGALAAIRGYEVTEIWTGPDDLVVKVASSFRSPNMSRTTNVMGTRISTRVEETKEKKLIGSETVGKEKRELTGSEVADLRSEGDRHPITLLAAWVQGKTKFRMIGQRSHMGRKVALLERVDWTKPRLRITIDPESGLLRTVETFLPRDDNAPLVVWESHDDYRRMGPYRVPLHRVTRVGDDVDGVDAVIKSFKFLR